MMRWICIAGLMALVIAALISGCGSQSSPIVTDAQFARDLLDALYAGSLTPLQASLDPPFMRGMPDPVTAAVGTLLYDQFGAASGLAFQSSGRPNQLALEAVWDVSAQKRDFQMKVSFQDGMAAGVWLRPSPTEDWSPLPMAGIEYGRGGRLPAGW